MKTLVIALSLLTSFNSFASPKEVLNCTTPGDALGSVDLVKDGTKSFINIVSMDGSIKKFSADVDVAKTNGGSIVGRTSKSLEYGGSITNSILMNLAKDNSSATLAHAGNVYFLTCQK